MVRRCMLSPGYCYCLYYKVKCLGFVGPQSRSIRARGGEGRLGSLCEVLGSIFFTGRRTRFREDQKVFPADPSCGPREEDAAATLGCQTNGR